MPEAIERLAVRYINRIDVPSPGIDLKQYFRTSPEISPDLPQELSGYFMQLTLPQPDLGGAVLINQAIIPPPKPDMFLWFWISICSASRTCRNRKRRFGTSSNGST